MTKEIDNHEHDENCNHDHDHNHEGEVDVIYLTFDDDEEVECKVLGVFEVENKEYIALLPSDEDEILLYEYKESEEDFDLIPIEDEKELDLVSKAYFELFEDESDVEYGEYDEEE